MHDGQLQTKIEIREGGREGREGREGKKEGREGEGSFCICGRWSMTHS